MQNTNLTVFARAIADAMVVERFEKAYGVQSLDEYVLLVNKRSTQHLIECQRDQLGGAARRQREGMRLTLEGDEVIVHLAMRNPNLDKTVWASLHLATWFDLMEMGADTSWRFRVKGKGRPDGQVVCFIPLGGKFSNESASLARLILNAKPGQRAMTRDGNSLNLRRGNLFLLGVPNGSTKLAKTDTAALMSEQFGLRASLAGQDYGYNVEHID